MPRFVALFRGINVGKATRIAMADLRALLASMGYENVQTLLNSGNAVFDSSGTASHKHAARIQAANILLDCGWGRAPQARADEDRKDIRVTIRKIGKGGDED